MGIQCDQIVTATCLKIYRSILRLAQFVLLTDFRTIFLNYNIFPLMNPIVSCWFNNYIAAFVMQYEHYKWIKHNIECDELSSWKCIVISRSNLFKTKHKHPFRPKHVADLDSIHHEILQSVGVPFHPWFNIRWKTASIHDFVHPNWML